MGCVSVKIVVFMNQWLAKKVVLNMLRKCCLFFLVCFLCAGCVPKEVSQLSKMINKEFAQLSERVTSAFEGESATTVKKSKPREGHVTVASRELNTLFKSAAECYSHSNLVYKQMDEGAAKEQTDSAEWLNKTKILQKKLDGIDARLLAQKPSEYKKVFNGLLLAQEQTAYSVQQFTELNKRGGK